MQSVALNILDKLKDNKFKEYIKNYNVNTVLVFGSVLSDEFNEESDIDIAILGPSKFSIQDILKLELFLEDYLNRPIDVVDLNSDTLDIFIKISILNSGKSIYSKDSNKLLESFIDKTDWYYKENEYYFSLRKRDLLS